MSFYLIIYNTLYSYQWFKNNVKLQTNDRVVVNEESGEIAFKNLTKEDFGMYYCLAHNEFGSSVSSFAKLNEADENIFCIPCYFCFSNTYNFHKNVKLVHSLVYLENKRISLKPLLPFVENQVTQLHARCSITARSRVQRYQLVNHQMTVN